MAYDLILGQTARDWSCGAHPAPSPRSSVDSSDNLPPTQMAEIARREVSASAIMAIRLRKADALPPSEWETCRKFHSKWNNYWDSHRGRFEEQDRLGLWNFRELNRQILSRLQLLGKLASTPLKKPTPPSTPTVTTPENVSGTRTWPLLLGIGLAAGAMALSHSKEKNSS